jgi:uncharacterized membrane protein YfcA
MIAVYMSPLSPVQWALAVLAAFGMGVAKGGLAGVSLFHVVVFAFLFGARDSTGIVLPMLLVGDVCAVTWFRQHARWDYIRKMLPPACAGIVLGWLVMHRISDALFKPLIGGIILTLAILQLARTRRPDWFGDVPHNVWFAWTMGLFTGVASMLANAAGPIFALFALAVSLPKFEMVGTSAWLFLIINALKIPFSVSLGLIHEQTLTLNLTLAPIVAVGVLSGRWLMKRLPQRLFDGLLLAFAAIAALRLIGVL